MNGYPTVKFFMDSMDNDPVEYHGDRSLEDIVRLYNLSFLLLLSLCLSHPFSCAPNLHTTSAFDRLLVT